MGHRSLPILQPGRHRGRVEFLVSLMLHPSRITGLTRFSVEYLFRGFKLTIHSPVPLFSML
jgi:hypothetical protein